MTLFTVYGIPVSGIISEPKDMLVVLRNHRASVPRKRALPAKPAPSVDWEALYWHQVELNNCLEDEITRIIGRCRCGSSVQGTTAQVEQRRP